MLGQQMLFLHLEEFLQKKGIVPEAQIEVANNIYHLGHAVTVQKGIKLRDKVQAPSS